MTETGNDLPKNFNALPREIKQRIFLEMPLDKLLELRQVDKEFNETINNLEFLRHYQKHSKYKNQLTEEKLQKKLTLAKLYISSGELEECEKAFIQKIVKRLETKKLCDCTDINSLISSCLDQMPSFKAFEEQKKENDNINEKRRKEALEKKFIEKVLDDARRNLYFHYAKLLCFPDVSFISLVNKGVIQNKYYDYILMAITKVIENSANELMLNQNCSVIDEETRSVFTFALKHAEATLFFLYLLSGNVDAVHSRWSLTELPSKINDFLKILLQVVRNEQADRRHFKLPYYILPVDRKFRGVARNILISERFGVSSCQEILVELPALLSDIYLQHDHPDQNELQVNYFKKFKNCLDKYYDKKSTSLINAFSREWTLSDEQITSLNDREKFNFFMIGLIAKNRQIVEKLGTACDFDKLNKETLSLSNRLQSSHAFQKWEQQMITFVTNFTKGNEQSLIEVHALQQWEQQMITFVTNFTKGNEQALINAQAANYSLRKKLYEDPYISSNDQYYQHNVSAKLIPLDSRHSESIDSRVTAGILTLLIGCATLLVTIALTMLTAIALPYLVAGMLVGSALIVVGVRLYLRFKPANIIKESSSKYNECVNPNNNRSQTCDTGDKLSQQPAPTVSSSTIFNVNTQGTDNTTGSMPTNEPLPPNAPADNERRTSP